MNEINIRELTLEQLESTYIPELFLLGTPSQLEAVFRELCSLSGINPFKAKGSMKIDRPEFSLLMKKWNAKKARPTFCSFFNFTWKDEYGGQYIFSHSAFYHGHLFVQVGFNGENGARMGYIEENGRLIHRALAHGVKVGTRLSDVS